MIDLEHNSTHFVKSLHMYTSVKVTFWPVMAGYRLGKGLGPKYTKPGLQAEKNRAHHKYKKNIAITDCLVILYQLEGSRSSLYSICIYSKLGFFSPAVRA